MFIIFIALFGLGSCFGNSVAFGIPLMYSILGPIDAMPYMILVLFHGFIHFTYTTLIIEGYRNRTYSIFKMVDKCFDNLYDAKYNNQFQRDQELLLQK